jgi:hypothetical protein
MKQATVPLMQNADSSPSRRVGFQQRGIISLPPVMISRIDPSGVHITTADDSGLASSSVQNDDPIQELEQERGRSQSDTIHSSILGSIPGISLGHQYTESGSDLQRDLGQPRRTDCVPIPAVGRELAVQKSGYN